MTRSHKLNDRDHVGLADGSAAPEEHLPRYFAKSGHVDADPKKTKKDGGGKGNWYVSSLYSTYPIYPSLCDIAYAITGAVPVTRSKTTPTT